MIKGDKFGDEIYSSFVVEHLKVNLDIGLKKAKKTWNVVLVIREDKQAFGVRLGGRSEPRRGVPVPCYISAINLSIPKIDS